MKSKKDTAKKRASEAKKTTKTVKSTDKPQAAKSSKGKSLVARAVASVKGVLTRKKKTATPAPAKAAPVKAASKAAVKRAVVSAEPKAAAKTEPKSAASTADTAKSAPAPVKVSASTKSSAARAAAKTPAKATAKAAATIPSILLEGDEPPAPPARGRGERFTLGVQPKYELPSDMGELPDAYGTGTLFVTARDPHWLYANWDFTDDQLRAHNKSAKGGHLSVRVFDSVAKGKPLSEVEVHPESRNWFLHVERGGRNYVAELGYRKKSGGTWVSLATSEPVRTPPDTASDDHSVTFATIPVELSFAQLLALLKQAARDHVPLAEAIEQLRLSGFFGLPDVAAVREYCWTPEQERAMAAVLSMDSVRRVWMGSLEITELLRRQMLRELSSISASQLGQISSQAVSSLSSPFGGGEAGRGRGFWFNVNAELIIYGATEPDATVTIGGRKIQLRRDGSFSYRFALPDGNFDLPAIATCAAGDDTRSAALKFSRQTDYSGDVGVHPQDPALRPPKAEFVQ
jgi:hypothetical protein